MKFLLSLLLALRFLTAYVEAGEPQQAFDQLAGFDAQLETLFAPNRDALDIKLTVDAMAEPSAHIDENRAIIEKLVAVLLPMAKDARTSHDKLKVLRCFLYEGGPWNDHQPFAYDMADPLGKKPKNQLLSRYLQTRRGNCVSMPILVMILGRRIGLKMTLAVAPFHMFVKFTDEAGKEWNLEATSGAGYTRDSYYRQNIAMTDEAVAKGTYLRALLDEEVTAVILETLAQKAKTDGEFERTMVIATVMLRHAPRLANAWIYRGSAAAKLLQRDIIGHYQQPSDMQPDVRAFAEALSESNRLDFAEAEALGWTERDGMKQ